MEVNGYIIQYNEYWKSWQVSHPEIGANIAEFDSDIEAIEYAKKG